MTLMDDTNDFRSPTVKRSRLSIEDAQDTSVSNSNNDDEKRKRKQSRRDALGSNGFGLNGQSPTQNMTVRRKSVGFQKELVNTKMKEHYALCIQLSSTNKINSNNAFKLLLIDHMEAVVQNIKDENLNFKLASSTLDAGTKIYCSRVDSVHSEAQKVASGLVNALDGQRQKKSASEEEDKENCPDEGEQAEGRKQKKKYKKKVKTIDTNQNLSIAKVDNMMEFDQIFLKINSAFDMSTMDSLLLNNLNLNGIGQLTINSKKLLSEKIQAETVAEETVECLLPINALDASSCSDVQICPRLTSFRFENRIDSLDNCESMLAFCETQEDEDLPDRNLYEDDFDMGGGGGDYEENSGGDIGGGDSFEMNLEGQMDIKAQPINGISKLLTDKPSEYTYFKRKLCNTWAGPKFWKSQLMNVGAKSLTAKKQKKIDEKISFDEIINDVTFSDDREKNKLRLNTLKSWMESVNELPKNFWLDTADFVKPFTIDHFSRLKLSYKIRGVPDIPQLPCVQSASEPKADNLMYDMDDAPPDTGFDINTSIDSNTGLTNNAFLTEEYDAGTIEIVDNNGRFTGDNLIDQPFIIQQIDLPYAKFAKKVDVKKLKGLIWDVVQHPPTKTDLNESFVPTDTIPMNETDATYASLEQGISFTLLYKEITHRVTPTMAQNISAPIAFVTLLHTVNEKSLKLVGQDDFKDFKIVNPEQI